VMPVEEGGNGPTPRQCRRRSRWPPTPASRAAGGAAPAGRADQRAWSRDRPPRRAGSAAGLHASRSPRGPEALGRSTTLRSLVTTIAQGGLRRARSRLSTGPGGSAASGPRGRGLLRDLEESSPPLAGDRS
jgi:hypothetical protein